MEQSPLHEEEKQKIYEALLKDQLHCASVSIGMLKYDPEQTTGYYKSVIDNLQKEIDEIKKEYQCAMTELKELRRFVLENRVPYVCVSCQQKATLIPHYKTLEESKHNEPDRKTEVFRNIGTTRQTRSESATKTVTCVAYTVHYAFTGKSLNKRIDG